MSTISIQQYLEVDERRDMLRFSTAGSIDDGKSTLIGRLLHDAKALFDDHVEAVRRESGVAGDLDFSLVTDGLKDEREQHITIDVAYRYFSTPRRKFIIADTPGHEQYTRNMATGASTADMAIVLIDARNGVLPQTKRHAFITTLLGVPHIVVAVNKMDLVGYSETVFNSICEEFTDFACKLKVADIRFIPVSALRGDNVAARSDRMGWYRGECLLEVLENIYIAGDRNLVDLRFPVQYVVRPHQDFRGYCGQVASGVIRKGDGVLVLPSMKATRVKSIVSYDGDLDTACCPMSVTVTLEDEIDVSRGDMIVHQHNVPRIGQRFEAMVVWMSERSMDASNTYFMKIGARVERLKIDLVRYKVDVNTLSRSSSCSLGLNDIGRVALSTFRPICFDSYERNRSTGSFIMIDELTSAVVAAGMIVDREPPKDLTIESLPPAKRGERVGGLRAFISQRSERPGRRPCSVWITGSSLSTRATFAERVGRLLSDRGQMSLLIEMDGVGQTLDVDKKCFRLRCGDQAVGALAAALDAAGIVALCIAGRSSDSAGSTVLPPREGEEWVTVCLDADQDGCTADAGFQDPHRLQVKAHSDSPDWSVDEVSGHLLDLMRFQKD